MNRWGISTFRKSLEHCSLWIAALAALSGCAAGDPLAAIPSQIGIDHVEFLDDMMGGLLESCGVDSYALSKDTISAIQSGGLAYLAQATEARAWEYRNKKIQYLGWHFGQLPKGDIENGLYGFTCARDDEHGATLEQMEGEADTGNVYYASTHEATLIIYPDAGIILFVHFG